MPKKLSDEQRRIYSRYSSNWAYLSNCLTNGASREEVGIMLKIEIEGKKRDHIINRLLGRLATMYRQEIKKELDSIMGV